MNGRMTVRLAYHKSQIRITKPEKWMQHYSVEEKRACCSGHSAPEHFFASTTLLFHNALNMEMVCGRDHGYARLRGALH